MYSENNYKSEHSSVATELLAETPELEFKCRAVEKAVRERYFSLEKAMSVYKVSEIEYIPYLLLKYNEELKNVKKQEQVFETLDVICSIFSSASINFDNDGKNVMNELKRITQNNPSRKELLHKVK